MIREIVHDRYGGYVELFQAHGWPERGSDMQGAVERRIAETYGTGQAFERWHVDPVVDPLEAIRADPPNVWLTSYYGFSEPYQNFWGFPEAYDRKHFLEDSCPGTLVVIYVAKSPKARRENRGKVIGMLQVVGPAGPARLFMSDRHWAEKQEDPSRRGKWNHAVRAGRAWRVTPESQRLVDEIATNTYHQENRQNIARRGARLEHSEAVAIPALDLVEMPVWGGQAFEMAVPGPGRDVLSPSRPGPVLQAPQTVSEAEGPKHLYILALQGDADAFLGKCALGRMIVKVGFSRSPEARCENYNRMLPRGAFRWIVHRSTFREQQGPFPSSAHAIAGENRMKALLNRAGTSLGGEFFLATSEDIGSAWRQGIEAANTFPDSL